MRPVTQAAMSMRPSRPILMTPPRSLVKPAMAARMRGVLSSRVSLSNGLDLTVSEGGGEEDEDAEDYSGDAFGDAFDLEHGPAFGEDSEEEPGGDKEESVGSGEECHAEGIETVSGGEIAVEAAFGGEDLDGSGESGDRAGAEHRFHDSGFGFYAREGGGNGVCAGEPEFVSGYGS